MRVRRGDYWGLLVLPPTRLSDHSPFWDAGYPALMITDTSFLRNPHYHEPTDTIDTLNSIYVVGKHQEHVDISFDQLGDSCALCHDVGKPYEFDPRNQERWSAQPATSGFPAIRHTQFGTHVCLTVGLPEEVCHAAGCHSGEGELVQRSLHVTIVHHADYAFWETLESAGRLDKT